MVQTNSEQPSGQQISVIATVSSNSRRKSMHGILNSNLIFIFHCVCIIVNPTCGIRVLVKYLGACFRLITGGGSLKINSFGLRDLYNWFLDYFYTLQVEV
jgi:hypothetical protein